MAHDIAVRLHLINTYLVSLPPYWIGLDVEQLCCTILQGLQAITRPTSSTLLTSLSPFASKFGWNIPTDPETCLVAFLKQQTKNARSFKKTCDDLIAKLAKGENDAEGLPDSAFQLLDAPNTSADFDDGIFRALQSIAECDPELHKTTDVVPAAQPDPGTLRHPARLCLHELGNSQDLASHVVVLASAMDMALWQEFCVRTYV